MHFSVIHLLRGNITWGDFKQANVLLNVWHRWQHERKSLPLSYSETTGGALLSIGTANYHLPNVRFSLKGRFVGPLWYPKLFQKMVLHVSTLIVITLKAPSFTSVNQVVLQCNAHTQPHTPTHSDIVVLSVIVGVWTGEVVPALTCRDRGFPLHLTQCFLKGGWTRKPYTDGQS